MYSKRKATRCCWEAIEMLASFVPQILMNVMSCRAKMEGLALMLGTHMSVNASLDSEEQCVRQVRHFPSLFRSLPSVITVITMVKSSAYRVRTRFLIIISGIQFCNGDLGQLHTSWFVVFHHQLWLPNTGNYYYMFNALINTKPLLPNPILNKTEISDVTLCLGSNSTNWLYAGSLRHKTIMSFSDLI